MKSYKNMVTEAYKTVLYPVVEEERNTSMTDEIRDKLTTFFKENPYPQDSAVHKFAEDNNIPTDELEAETYKMLCTFISFGKANGEGLTAKDVDPKELKMGIEVEYEHVDKDSPYGKKMAERIALDHLAEFGDYYTRLAKMEKEGEAAKEGKKE